MQRYSLLKGARVCISPLHIRMYNFFISCGCRVMPGHFYGCHNPNISHTQTALDSTYRMEIKMKSINIFFRFNQYYHRFAIVIVSTYLSLCRTQYMYYFSISFIFTNIFGFLQSVLCMCVYVNKHLLASIALYMHMWLYYLLKCMACIWTLMAYSIVRSNGVCQKPFIFHYTILTWQPFEIFYFITHPVFYIFLDLFFFSFIFVLTAPFFFFLFWF